MLRPRTLITIPFLVFALTSCASVEEKPVVEVQEPDLGLTSLGYEHQETSPIARIEASTNWVEIPVEYAIPRPNAEPSGEPAKDDAISGGRESFDKESLRTNRKLSIYFAYNSSDLTDVARRALSTWIAGIPEHMSVVAIGYADPTGGATYNLRLSYRRAESAARYLREVADGVNVVIGGAGEYSISDDLPDDLHSKERRVDLYFVSD